MVNTRKLKAKIVEKGLTIELLSEKTAITTATLYRKINGQADKLYIKEANEISKDLELDPDEIPTFFCGFYGFCGDIASKKNIIKKPLDVLSNGFF